MLLSHSCRKIFRAFTPSSGSMNPRRRTGKSNLRPARRLLLPRLSHPGSMPPIILPGSVRPPYLRYDLSALSDQQMATVLRLRVLNTHPSPFQQTPICITRSIYEFYPHISFFSTLSGTLVP